MTRLRHALAGAAIAALAAGATPAAASEAAMGPEPWQPIEQQEWTAPAGRYCDFPLHLDVQFDQERTRVLERYPDGAVKRQEFIGALATEFVNVDSGARLRVNASAQAIVDLRPDGSWERFTGHGPFGFGFRATDPYPRGYYLLTGTHAVEIDVDDTRRMALDDGREENVCESL